MVYEEAFSSLLDEDPQHISDQLLYTCPLEDCKYYQKKKFYVDPGTGLWYCHHCNKGGNYKSLCTIIGVEPETIDEENYTSIEKTSMDRETAELIWNHLYRSCKLTNTHYNIIKDRGLDPNKFRPVSADLNSFNLTIKKFGAEMCINAGLAKIRPGSKVPVPTLCCALGRIILPYWNDKNKTSISYFVGYQKPVVLSNPMPKIANIKDYKPPLYIRDLQNKAYVVITEGLFKAEAAIQNGINCIGLPGIAQCHKEAVSFCTEHNLSRIYICFDNEESNNNNVQQQELSLAEKLLDRGFTVFKIILPLDTQNPVKQDLDSYLKNHTRKDFRQLMIEATRRPFVLE